MKTILSRAALLFLGASFLTGCLKDEEFEAGQFGTRIQEVKGVAFPQSATGVSFSINSTSSSQTIDASAILLEQDGNASTDVKVTLSVNNALVTAAGLTPLPPSSYTINGGTTVTIPAGQKQAMIKLTFPNASTLDPAVRYGLGLSISSVSDGYTIAKNQKDLLISFAIKNQYDGVYSVVSGRVTRYTAPGVPANDALSGELAGNPDVKLITTGPNTVTIPAPASPNPGTLYWAYGQNSQVAGIDGVTITVNPTTNAVTMSSVLNATLANWAGKENKYDPATKTFYLAFRWNPATTPREYEVVLKYKGPR